MERLPRIIVSFSFTYFVRTESTQCYVQYVQSVNRIVVFQRTFLSFISGVELRLPVPCAS